MAMPNLPDSVMTPGDVTALESVAHVERRPCGDGDRVWRIWGEGEPLVLLHGGAGSWNHWVRNIAPLVRAGRRVLVPDMPGFGESAGPGGDDADSMPQWFERGLATLLGEATCDVAGFSLGALVCGFLAVRYPKRIRRIVLSGAPALSAHARPPINLRPWQAWPPGPRRDAVHRHNLRALMLAHDESIDELALALHAGNAERDRMRRRRLMRTDILLTMMPAIECPVDGIWGAEDALYRTRPQVIGDALRLAPRFHSLELIPHAGHWVQYERAAIFNDLLARALSS